MSSSLITVNNVFASYITFKTVQYVYDKDYENAQSKVINEIEKNIGRPLNSSEKAFFDSIKKPMNLGLLFMAFYPLITGLHTVYDMSSASMRNFKIVFKVHNVINSYVPYKNINVDMLMKKLRDSISHYRYRYDQINNKFVFTDDNQQGTKFVEFHFNPDELVNLLNEVSLFCMKNCVER